MSATLIVIETSAHSHYADSAVENVETALVRSLNKTADRARTRAAAAIREQINFPASYLSPSAKRLWVQKRARKGSFEAVIEGRGAATSLARFSKQKPGRRGGAVNVEVSPGKISSIKRAFLIKLNNSNIGLAVRTNGNKPVGAYKPREIGKNLWLLYGPSVDQALIAASSGGGVYQDMTPEMLDFLEGEFHRQMDLLEGTNA